MEEELRQCIGGLGQQKEKKRDDNGRGGGGHRGELQNFK